MRTTTRRAGGALLASALLVAVALAPAHAQDAGEGRKIATHVCQACHGLDGLAKQPDMPNIAGDDAAYLTRQLQAFRSGARQNELMSAVAGMLDDAKMADVAAYYSGLHVTVTPSGQ